LDGGDTVFSLKQPLLGVAGLGGTLVNSQHKPKELFSTIEKLLNQPTKNSIPLSITANEFSTFFTSKIAKIRDSILQKPTQTTEILNEFGNSIPELNFKPVTSEDIKLIIKSSKKTTSPLDPIPTHLLADIQVALLPTITYIINTIITSCVFPSDLKRAVICPILKKSSLDPLILNNYRPVSLLPFLSKITERVIANQLTDHINRNNLCDPFQSGFKKYHSTETALIRVVNDLLRSSDNGFPTMLVLLDLSAAFDAIDHSILIDRLKNYIGLSDSAVLLIKSYLQQ
jgi:hypothetical protein